MSQLKLRRNEAIDGVAAHKERNHRFDCLHKWGCPSLIIMTEARGIRFSFSPSRQVRKKEASEDNEVDLKVAFPEPHSDTNMNSPWLVLIVHTPFFFCFFFFFLNIQNVSEKSTKLRQRPAVGWSQVTRYLTASLCIFLNKCIYLSVVL